MKRKKQAIAMVMMLILSLSFHTNIYATEETDSGAAATEKELTLEELEEKQRQEDMEKAYAIPTESNQLAGWPEGPGTYGEASIVMDMESGAVLYAKNIDRQNYPASITKLATALIALENGNLEDKVTVNGDCVSFLRSDYSQIGLKEGEELTLHETLYATLLASANEAAYAVAANVGESYDWFITRMNERAKELGAENTNFVNPHGLHDDNHYTTARDMALIASELYKYPVAFDIMQTLEYQIPATNLDENVKYVHQKHLMLNPEKDKYYEYAIGGKTGYTDMSKTTLVTYADNGDLHLVCVELKARGKIIYEDTANLFDYAFADFEKVPIMENDQSGYIEAAEEGAYVVLPEKVSFDDLEMEIVENVDEYGKGTVTYTYGGQPVGSAEVTLSEAYLNPEPEETEEQEPEAAEPEEQPETKRNLPDRKVMIALLISLGIITIVVIVSITVRKIKKRNA